MFTQVDITKSNSTSVSDTTDVKVMSVTFLISGLDLVVDRMFHMTISHTPLGTQRHVEILAEYMRIGSHKRKQLG